MATGLQPSHSSTSTGTLKGRLRGNVRGKEQNGRSRMGGTGMRKGKVGAWQVQMWQQALLSQSKAGLREAGQVSEIR
jgi:hypothetical protein